MKKVLAVCIMAVMAIQLVRADEVITRDEKRLPAQARSFINQYFQDTKISYIKTDKEILQSKKFEVVMTNGMEIEFDSKGKWKEVDAKRNPIPVNIVPLTVRNYVSSNFKNNFITKIERDKKGIEVELNNDLTVKFDKNGNFIKLDD